MSSGFTRTTRSEGRTIRPLPPPAYELCERPLSGAPDYNQPLGRPGASDLGRESCVIREPSAGRLLHGFHVVVAEFLPVVPRQERLVTTGELGCLAQLLLRDVRVITVE